MQEVNINSLVDRNNFLIENITDNIIIIGKIKYLCIDRIYDQLDLSKVKCLKIYYKNQKRQSIKNHILPNSLKELDCSYNNLTLLPDNLPNSLQELDCYYNNLTLLPDNLPNSLQILSCFHNKLISLPDNLPNSLKELNCSNNRLISLPDNLPNSLINLICRNNKLTSLPDNLPNSLQKLYCSYNRLTSIPNLPNSLEYLSCFKNKLTSLPNLNSLNWIELGNININKIEYNPNYKNIKCWFYDAIITVGDYIIKSKEDYISYMEDYEKYLFSKVKSAKK